jgi:hypothetical protein
MDADGSVYGGVRSGDGHAGPGTGQVTADGENVADAGFAGPGDDGVQVSGELTAVKMGVGVDQRGEEHGFSIILKVFLTRRRNDAT